MQSISKEDYLSAIYKYRDDSGEIKSLLIAEKLEVSNAAVTDMFRKLSKEGLVIYEPYKRIKLTPEGEKIAINTVRKHRIWEMFLHKVVGMSWDEVHYEAHNLEHSTSDRLINRLEEILDYPSFDPHGDPIPSIDGTIPVQKSLLPLSKAENSYAGKVMKVDDYDKEMLTYISSLGIRIGSSIKVIERRVFDNSLSIEIDGSEKSITSVLANSIFIENRD